MSRFFCSLLGSRFLLHLSLGVCCPLLQICIRSSISEVECVLSVMGMVRYRRKSG